VTVKHINPVPGCVVCLDLDDFVLAKPDYVFETGGFVWLYAAAGARNDSEVDQVHMYLQDNVLATLV